MPTPTSRQCRRPRKAVGASGASGALAETPRQPVRPVSVGGAARRHAARRPQFVDVLKIIGVAMVARASDLRLGRDTRRSLVFSLVVECLHALNENRAPAVAYTSIQQMIRALDDEVRAYAAGVIRQFVRDISGRNERTKPDQHRKICFITQLRLFWAMSGHRNALFRPRA
jgi:hypothetical protein